MRNQYYPRDKKFRPTYAEIDLKALIYNVKALRRCAGKQQLLTVIKADAYGHGMLNCAKTLKKLGIKLFGVADIDEGIYLRKNGIKNDILVFEHALPKYAKQIVDNNLIQTVCTLELARAISAYAQKKRKKAKIHIKIDTGMGRLGVWHEDALDFVKKVSKLKGIMIDGICTHFPVADTNVKYTKKQIQIFKKLIESIKKNGINIPRIHAANSIGVVDFKLNFCTVARPGIMLYGLYPADRLRSKIKLKPIMSVKSKIVFLKKITKRRGISYGHTFFAKKGMKIATIPIGYSDGYFRLLSNKAFVLVGGKRCPVVGRVTMDQIMVDVTKVMGVKVGDEVVLMGSQKKKQISANELADLARTINYEVTCSLGSRLTGY